MTAPAVEKVTARDLHAAILARYEAPEWHVETEVTLGGRRLDVVALNQWGARAYRVVGFELKVSRGDWLRELNAFQKSQEWMAVVDSFYVVTPPKLIKAEEIPAGWGHLELCGTKMMTRQHAAVREGCVTIPREVAARFITRLARADREAERTAEFRARQIIREEVVEQVRASVDRDGAALREELNTLRNEHRELLEVLGVNPMQWRAHEASLRAAGVFAKATDQPHVLRGQLARLATGLAEHVDHIRAALAKLDEASA